jgi:peptidoglycan/LPS O-acetylase OafA/YrhL
LTTTRNRLRLIWIAGGLSVAALGLRIAFVLNISPQHNEPWMLHLLPFRMDALLIGAILALVLRGPRAGAWQRSCAGLFWLATATAIAVCLLSPSLTSPWFNTLGISLVALGSAGLIGAALRPGSIAFRVFHLPPLRVLGRYSYGFYVYHTIWAGGWHSLSVLLATRLHSPVLGNGLAGLLNFAATLLAAKLSYDLFEVRFLRLKKRFEYDSELTSHRHAFSLK